MDIYADRIGGVIVSEGVVRLDLLRLDSIDADAKQRKMTPAGRLVLPLDAFMQMSNVVQQMREKIAAEVAAQKAKGTPEAAQPSAQ